MIYSDGITKRINGIRFATLSPEEIRKMSAIKVITPDTYDDEGYPYSGGLMDPHMGVIEPGIRCKTCGCKVDECPGHFGHIAIMDRHGSLYCPVCKNNTNIYQVQTSYAFKLLMDELLSLGVAMRLQLEDLK